MILAPFDPDRLWVKARLFINRSFEKERDFAEQAFWAATSFELLGKGALARVSPLLIANPTDDGHSLLAATGRISDDGFFSIPAKAVWSRCDRLFKPFHKGEANWISNLRNEYLHAGAAGFDVPPTEWWPRFWAQAVILLHHLEEDPSGFVGDTRAPIVHGFLDQNRANVARRLEANIERARARLAQRQNGTLTVAQARAWDTFAPMPYMYWADVDCPACNAVATVRGSVVLDRDEDVYYTDVGGGFEGPGGVYVTLTVRTDELACNECHLRLDDYALIEAAGFEGTFEATADADEWGYDEPDYNNE